VMSELQRYYAENRERAAKLEEFGRRNQEAFAEQAEFVRRLAIGD
jgi:hypothetical protein